MKIIFEKLEKQRLDKFLVEQLPDLSRAKIQRLIEDGLVEVNGKRASKHFFLKQGDIVKYRARGSKLVARGSKLVAKIMRPGPAVGWPEIIKETDDYVVINKPAGLLVHPTDAGEENTLAAWLVKKYPKIKKVGEDPLRPGIVHRLDKDVSGLLIVARNQEAFEHLKNQFRGRKVKKEYTALVYGKIEKDEGEIDFSIARSKIKGLFSAKPKKEEGRLAQTSFEVIKRYINYTLVKLSPSTGRTHQLRVHLKALGHSIVGDQLYKIKKLKEKIKPGRIFLEANYLGFYDLAGEWVEFRLELDSELHEVLKNLK